jgi:superfamily II DNA helicase RecQ
MKTLNAGYVSEAAWKAIQDNRLSQELNWHDVLMQLSQFVIDRDVGGEGVLPPELAVLENIICRGLPTLPSLYVEKKLEQLTGLTKNGKGGNEEVATYFCDFDPALAKTWPSVRALLERAYCPASPEAKLEPSPGFLIPGFHSGNKNTDFDSQAESIFWDGPLTAFLGRGGMQLVVRQRPMSTIAGEGFDEQRTDFSVQFPGSKEGITPKGFIFEVDGPTHGSATAQTADERRDKACERAGWGKTYRHRLWQNITASNPVDTKHPGVAKVLKSPYLLRVNENILKPLSGDDFGRRVNILALFPLAVARIQRVLLELIRGGIISVDAPVWNIVVLDRDGLAGCGETAIEDFQYWLRKLWAIYRPGVPGPDIRIREISQHDSGPTIQEQVDVLLDVSVQLRYGASLPEPPGLPDAIQRVVIRSDYFPSDQDHYLSFGDLLSPKVDGAQLEQELIYFLQNIFRKVAFRPKQTDIIIRALRGESVIALLPTGAGKSITYQMATLLQNGMTIVVDPIKALMKDQDDNLKAIGISSSCFINSMSTGNERRRNTELMQKGCFKFVFVSPERFIIREFRDALRKIRDDGKVHFAYVVVDEAHCVSEWGHDFRTAYLRLGENARKYCATRSPKLPLLALTGTASYEVLDDIHVELGFKKGDNISVRPDSMERQNLQYQVIPLEAATVIPTGTNAQKTSKIVGQAKLEKLPGTLGKMTQSLISLDVSSFINEDKGSGLVFCPHGTWVHGAEDVCNTLRDSFKDVKDRFGVYYGSAEDKAEGVKFDPIKTQNDFKRGTLKVLACTKAFGMGIDKPDIRFTLHYNIPPSLESFYQEAGRAGRDGNESQCWILYAGTPIPGTDHTLDYSLNHSFHSNTFPGPGIEEAKVFEMLDANRSPGYSVRNYIENMLLDNTGVDFTVNFWHPPNDNIYRIYINHPGYSKAKVFLELASNGSISQRNSNPYPNHEQVTRLVMDWVDTNKPAGITWPEWISQKKEAVQDFGIEDLLNKVQEDDTTTVCLSFENGYLEDIATRLGVQLAEVRKAHKFKVEAGEFIAKLKQNITIGAADEAWIKDIFPKVRLREHTFRAIYRLSILGAVDDFEADYAGATITATLRRQPQGRYRENLQQYIRRYAPTDVEKYLQMADRCAYKTELRRCLHALIQFVYDRIAKQRIEALKIMEQTTVKGLTDKKAFAEAVTNFFDSSYLPILRPFLNQYTSDLVFDICDDTAGSDAKLNHLLGACNRLLPENPDNAAFHALRGYATALLGYKDQDVMNEITDAIAGFEKDPAWDRKERLLFLMRLRGKIRAVNVNRTSAFDATIIDDHTMWLRNFNTELGQL